MMIIDLSAEQVAEDHASESFRHLESVIDELAREFALHGWTWSGNAPDREAINWKCLTLMHSAIESAKRAPEGYGNVSSGRVRCEVRPFGEGYASATFHLCYALGM